MEFITERGKKLHHTLGTCLPFSTFHSFSFRLLYFHWMRYSSPLRLVKATILRGINTIPFTDCNDEFLKCQSDNLLNHNENQIIQKQQWMGNNLLGRNPFSHSLILYGDKKRIAKSKWLYFWISKKGIQIDSSDWGRSTCHFPEGWIFAHVCNFFSF